MAPVLDVPPHEIWMALSEAPRYAAKLRLWLCMQAVANAHVVDTMLLWREHFNMVAKFKCVVIM